MKTVRSTRGGRLAQIAGLVVGIAALFTAGGARAHFVLKTPTNWMTLDVSGSPQKVGPCGNEAPQNPSNAVTSYQAGDTVMIQLDETVFHPGHYRVALAPTQADLPPEPVVTPTAQDQCASAAVEPNPTLPILADDLLDHSAPFSGTQTIMVTLPANPPCTNCVLQVLEFMSSHGAPCFYHHCANITIGASGGGGGGDAGPAAANPDAGDAPATDSGCSCSTARPSASRGIGPYAGFALAVCFLGRRRRRAALGLHGVRSL
jgi:MYXO-CTERM domain-containing protein